MLLLKILLILFWIAKKGILGFLLCVQYKLLCLKVIRTYMFLIMTKNSKSTQICYH